jgi:hypothetical protein
MFAETITDKKGKTRKRYPLALIMTPFEKLASLAQVADFLRPGITIATLRATATAMSDNAAAEQMNQARQQLFLSINKRSRIGHDKCARCALDKTHTQGRLECQDMPTDG